MRFHGRCGRESWALRICGKWRRGRWRRLRGRRRVAGSGICLVEDRGATVVRVLARVSRRRGLPGARLAGRSLRAKLNPWERPGRDSLWRRTEGRVVLGGRGRGRGVRGEGGRG